ncbi:MAG TPA: glucose 1-dehydrogenase [Steroidobacteraceae bacterium]|nr:glucose 1-dehydrogenase [Steroidobacteraceae bacterium]
MAGINALAGQQSIGSSEQPAVGGTNMGRLSGKVAVITGASQGMGAEHARAFVREGAKAVLTDINAKAGAALAEQLGSQAMFVSHDVRREDQWRAVLRQAEDRFGSVNVLINNAGVIGPVAELTELSEGQFLDVCAVNQLGVFLGMRVFLPAMVAGGGGSIVNVSSIAGLVGLDASPNFAYVASKFAVRGMTKLAARRYGPAKIRVNSVHPGYIRTPMMVAATDDEGGGAAADIPLRRFAEPEEVSNLMVFLASDESSFITGAEHLIDGGMLAG